MDLPYSKATRGPRPRGPIVIVPYRGEWPDEFRLLGNRVREALGPLALRIDHIGSTAVPGLAAKDVIDMQVTVGDLNEAVAEAMQRAGYEWREPIRMDHVPPGSRRTSSNGASGFIAPKPNSTPRTSTFVWQGT